MFVARLHDIFVYVLVQMSSVIQQLSSLRDSYGYQCLAFDLLTSDRLNIISGKCDEFH